MRRNEMRPGQMFVVRCPEVFHEHDVMVVLDSKTEIGFWRGEIWAWGDAAPAVEFEVVS